MIGTKKLSMIRKQIEKGVTGRPLIGNRLANGRLRQSDAGQVGLLGLDM